PASSPNTARMRRPASFQHRRSCAVRRDRSRRRDRGSRTGSLTCRRGFEPRRDAPAMHPDQVPIPQRLDVLCAAARGSRAPPRRPGGGVRFHRCPIGRSFGRTAHSQVDFNQRGNVMSRLTACVRVATLVCVGLAGFLAPTQSTYAFDRNKAQLFAVWPAGSTLPEGLAVDPSNGDVYVATFDGSKTIVVYNENGKHLRTLNVGTSSGALLGLAFHPHTGAFLVIDFGAGTVLNVN